MADLIGPRDRWSTSLLSAVRRLRCPTAGTLAAHVDRRLAPNRDARVRAHVEICPDCATAASQLRQMSEARLPEVPTALLHRAKAAGGRSRSVGARTMSWRIAGSIATASLLLAIGLRFARPSDGEPERHPEGWRTIRGTADVEVAPTVVVPERNVILTGRIERLEWTEAPDAVVYEIHLLDAEGSLIESLSTTGEVSASLQSVLAPGIYFVGIEATLQDGRSLKGPFRRFEVRTPG